MASQRPMLEDLIEGVAGEQSEVEEQQENGGRQEEAQYAEEKETDESSEGEESDQNSAESSRRQSDSADEVEDSEQQQLEASLILSENEQSKAKAKGKKSRKSQSLSLSPEKVKEPVQEVEAEQPRPGSRASNGRKHRNSGIFNIASSPQKNDGPSSSSPVRLTRQRTASNSPAPPSKAPLATPFDTKEEDELNARIQSLTLDSRSTIKGIPGLELDLPIKPRMSVAALPPPLAPPEKAPARARRTSTFFNVPEASPQKLGAGQKAGISLGASMSRPSIGAAANGVKPRGLGLSSSVTAPTIASAAKAIESKASRNDENQPPKVRLVNGASASPKAVKSAENISPAEIVPLKPTQAKTIAQTVIEKQATPRRASPRKASPREAEPVKIQTVEAVQKQPKSVSTNETNNRPQTRKAAPSPRKASTIEIASTLKSSPSPNAKPRGRETPSLPANGDSDEYDDDADLQDVSMYNHGFRRKSALPKGGKVLAGQIQVRKSNQFLI